MACGADGAFAASPAKPVGTGMNRARAGGARASGGFVVACYSVSQRTACSMESKERVCLSPVKSR